MKTYFIIIVWALAIGLCQAQSQFPGALPVQGTGDAGSETGKVLTVQGISNGTPIPVDITGYSATSISQGGGSCAVDSAGAIDCTPTSGEDFTVTVAGGGTATVAGGQLLISDGSVSAPALAFSGAGGGGFWRNTTFNHIGFGHAGGYGGQLLNAGMWLKSTSALRWQSSTAESATTDTGLGRNAAGVVEVNTGVLGTFADLIAAKIGIGVTPTLGLLHMDKGTGFGQVTLDGSSGGCIMFRDTDDAGWTQVTFLNGTITSAMDADGVCD